MGKRGGEGGGQGKLMEEAKGRGLEGKAKLTGQSLPLPLVSAIHWLSPLSIYHV